MSKEYYVEVKRELSDSKVHSINFFIHSENSKKAYEFSCAKGKEIFDASYDKLNIIISEIK